ncbi:hypothetical protein ACFX15_008369 [Malus domestica]
MFSPLFFKSFIFNHRDSAQGFGCSTTRRSLRFWRRRGDLLGALGLESWLCSLKHDLWLMNLHDLISESNSSNPIKTVVVLVQENRSFDHMLGWIKSINLEINGVTGSESNPISTSDPNSTQIFFHDNSAYVDPDPGHSIQAVYEQVFGEPWTEGSASKTLPPTMNGFAQNAKTTQTGLAETVMNGFWPENVLVHKELVNEFTVCDRWFASVPATTQPNQQYIHSATSHGLTRNDNQKLIEGLPQKTIFQSLDEEGFSFGIYFQSFPSTLLYR